MTELAVENLAAIAALASLRATLPALDFRTGRERYGWAKLDDGLRSWAPGMGGGGSGGGHADPIGSAVAGSVRSSAARRARWTAETLVWLAARLGLDGDPVDALEAGIPDLRPSTAYHLTLWLEELHDQVRATLDGRDG